MDMNLGKFREVVRDREAWDVAVHVVAKSWKWLIDWTITTTTKWCQSCQGTGQYSVTSLIQRETLKYKIFKPWFYTISPISFKTTPPISMVAHIIDKADGEVSDANRLNFDFPCLWMLPVGQESHFPRPLFEEVHFSGAPRIATLIPYYFSTESQQFGSKRSSVSIPLKYGISSECVKITSLITSSIRCILWSYLWKFMIFNLKVSPIGVSRSFPLPL